MVAILVLISFTYSSIKVIYPLKELQLIGNMRLPRDVNRTKLEVRTWWACMSSLPQRMPRGDKHGQLGFGSPVLVQVNGVWCEW